MAKHANVGVRLLSAVALVLLSCAHGSGGVADDIELLPPRLESWRADYDRLTTPCDGAPEYWVPITDYPNECTYLPTLEFWIRESIHIDNKNRATLGR